MIDLEEDLVLLWTSSSIILKLLFFLHSTQTFFCGDPCQMRLLPLKSNFKKNLNSSFQLDDVVVKYIYISLDRLVYIYNFLCYFKRNFKELLKASVKNNNSKSSSS